MSQIVRERNSVNMLQIGKTLFYGRDMGEINPKKN